MVGAQPVGFERVDREPRREPGRAEGHRLARGEAVGQRDDPPGGHACVLRPAAVVCDSEVVAGDQHLAADGHRRIVGFDHLARKVDAGHER